MSHGNPPPVQLFEKVVHLFSVCGCFIGDSITKLHPLPGYSMGPIVWRGDFAVMNDRAFPQFLQAWSFLVIEGTFALIAGVGYGSLTQAVEPEKPLRVSKLI